MSYSAAIGISGSKADRLGQCSRKTPDGPEHRLNGPKLSGKLETTLEDKPCVGAVAGDDVLPRVW